MILNKMKFIKNFGVVAMMLSLSACTQNTPSMMNTSAVQLSHTTMMEQIAFEDINDHVLSSLAAHYLKNGTSEMDLTMVYNPTSQDFTAMSAVHELNHIKNFLKKKGVHNVASQTTAIPNGHASLIVSYDMVQALAPQGCDVMPGLVKDDTTRFLGDYKFGCSTETMLAKQIAHPADLQGNGKLGARDARRDAIVIDNYQRGESRTPLEGLGRNDLEAE